jgi:hypothetical protein
MRTVPRLLLLWVFVVLALVGLHGQAPRTFRVWVFADAHVGSDQKNPRPVAGSRVPLAPFPSY